MIFLTPLTRALHLFVLKLFSWIAKILLLVPIFKVRNHFIHLLAMGQSCHLEGPTHRSIFISLNLIPYLSIPPLFLSLPPLFFPSGLSMGHVVPLGYARGWSVWFGEESGPHDPRDYGYGGRSHRSTRLVKICIRGEPTVLSWLIELRDKILSVLTVTDTWVVGADRSVVLARFLLSIFCLSFFLSFFRLFIYFGLLSVSFCLTT